MLELHPPCWYSVRVGDEFSLPPGHVTLAGVSVAGEEAGVQRFDVRKIDAITGESHGKLGIANVDALIVDLFVRPREFRFSLLELIARLGILLTIRF